MAKEDKRKKQHFVPQLYLKNFSSQEKKFSLLNIKKNQVVNDVPYMDQCYEDYFYGSDKKWENELSRLEGKWASIFDKIILNASYYPSHEEISLIKEFVVYQAHRTPSINNQIKEYGWKLIETAVNMQYGKTLDIIDPKIKQQVKIQFIKEKMSNTSQMCLEISKNVVKAIKDLNLLIINYTGSIDLVTSDNPIIFYNDYCIYSTGLSQAGLIIFFPVSSRKLIVIYDSKMYPRFKEKKIVELNNESEVKLLNKFQIISADNLVFFKNKIMSDLVKKLKKEVQNERKLYFESLIPYDFGPDKDKLVPFHKPNHPLKCNFSFAKLNSKAEKISKYDRNVKDWFTRKKKKEIIERMKIRENILPQIPDPVIKMYRKNDKLIKEVNKFIYDYWDDNL